MRDSEKPTFEKADARSEEGLFRQLAELIRENKKYWLVPVILALAALGALVVLGGGAAAPFIYTLF